MGEEIDWEKIEVDGKTKIQCYRRWYMLRDQTRKIKTVNLARILGTQPKTVGLQEHVIWHQNSSIEEGSEHLDKIEAISTHLAAKNDQKNLKIRTWVIFN